MSDMTDNETSKRKKKKDTKEYCEVDTANVVRNKKVYLPAREYTRSEI